jgi:hypothetical protein
MKTRIARLGILAVFALGFTGTAIADNGGGNGKSGAPPGQAKKADTTQATAPPTAQPATQPAAATGNGKKSPGQVKQAAKASTSTPGMKPSNSTSHRTHCSTGGGTGTSATCTGNGPKADGSKQYGNGKTAAQIANSRGAPAGTVLTGPGNSQPHKVTVCGKPNNKSGGVDVHAVKSYSSANCNQQQQASQAQQTQVTSNCAGATSVTSATSSRTVVANKHGKVKAHGSAGMHGKHKGLKSETLSSTSSSTTFTPNNANCGTAQNAATATAPAAPAPGGQTAAASAGAVLGAQATMTRPASKSAGGVLGAFTRLGTLPFTGFPLWIAVLVALALIAGGLAVRSTRANER